MRFVAGAEKLEFFLYRPFHGKNPLIAGPLHNWQLLAV